FYAQWRQRFSPEFITTQYAGAEGWKQAIIGTGDLPGCSQSSLGQCVSSCSTLEIVTVNSYDEEFPQMYHNCGHFVPFQEKYGASDFKYQNAMPAPYCLLSQGQTSWFPPTGNCFGYFPNEWMTFQVHVQVGPYVNGQFINSQIDL